MYGMAPIVVSHFDAIFGGAALLLANALAWALTVRSARALKRSEITSQTLQTWFGLEYGKIRIEVIKVARRILHENDYSDINWLINADLKTYTDQTMGAPGDNGLLPSGN